MDFPINDYERAVLVVIRRAGKSFLLFQKIQSNLKYGIKWKEMLYINFEDERLKDFSLMDFDLLVEIHFELYGKRHTLFLDEIQNIKRLGKLCKTSCRPKI